ncbi:DUF1833 family protein [Luteimonas sp. FCS-9]|uniref:DUF1833 family protein n=1 Tax=Luteimonas sp. FCS-9 TaxID=1547516 RepID=UPI00063EB340|nr:DUF1833 family protein [Luteimonas sp. FCS-9]KLJ02817.1 hypothetical protein WQ56_00575 [Luteimonas sp. FCS-9]
MSTFLERRQRTRDRHGTLLFLEIRSTSMPEVLRVVNDTQNWTSNGVEYIGAPFGFKEPDDVAGQTPRAQLVMATGGASITEDLEALPPGELLLGRLMLSDRANPHVYARVWNLPMTHVSSGGGQATAQLGVDYLLRQRAVRLLFNPFTAPGLP